MNAQWVFASSVLLIAALLAAGGSLWYCARVRMERPPIGQFNGRDLTILGCFIVALPPLYLVLPPVGLTVMLVITFLSAGTTTLRPLISGPRAWVVVPGLLIANILVARHVEDVPGGLQLFWVLNTTIVLIAAVGIGNLYVQGGLTIRHVAWFTAFLGAYDIVFTRLIPLTGTLGFALQGRPLEPAAGFQIDGMFATLGLGDALMFSLYTAVAYKSFGRRGAIAALGVVALAGALLPVALLVLAPDFVTGTVGDFFPVQAVFAPAVFVSWKWLSRTTHERSTRQWLAASTTRIRSRPVVRRSRSLLAPSTVAVAALVLVTTFATGEQAAVGGEPVRDTAPRPGRAVAMTMEDVKFVPARTVVRVGQTITWTNQDFVPHDVVATAGAGFESDRFSRGGSFSWRADRPGAITYGCTLHEGMDAMITVVR